MTDMVNAQKYEIKCIIIQIIENATSTYVLIIKHIEENTRHKNHHQSPMTLRSSKPEDDEH